MFWFCCGDGWAGGQGGGGARGLPSWMREGGLRMLSCLRNCIGLWWSCSRGKGKERLFSKMR